MSDDFRRRCRDYEATLSVFAEQMVFSWSGRLVTPLVSDGQIVRQAFGTVKARTFVEAAAALALQQLAAPPDHWVDDVILSCPGRKSAMAWDRRRLTEVLDNPQLRHRDEAEPCQIP